MTSALVRWRVEDEGFSWGVFVGGALTGLGYGQSLPERGDLIDDSVVDKIEPNFDIQAQHLEHRERFDPRRIYETPNGTRVVFKRVEAGKVVLWSYKTNGEIMVGGSMVLDRTDAVAKPTAASRRVMTQKLLASYLIANDPNITAAGLTAILQEEFPSCKVGKRHGSHYISQSKNGRLPEPPSEDPRSWPDRSGRPQSQDVFEYLSGESTGAADDTDPSGGL